MKIHADKICSMTSCHWFRRKAWCNSHRIAHHIPLGLIAIVTMLATPSISGAAAVPAVMAPVSIQDSRAQDGKPLAGKNAKTPVTSKTQKKTTADENPFRMQVRPRPQRGVTDHGIDLPQQPLNPAEQSPMEEEINEIRRRIGGGVSESLEGMLTPQDQATMQRVFNEQLRMLDQQQERPTPVRRGANVNPNQRQTPRSRTPGQRPAGFSPAPDRVVGYQPLGIPVMANQGRVSVLRRSARKLDEAAADLEEIAEYRHADQLRGTARLLREQARRMTGNK